MSLYVGALDEGSMEADRGEHTLALVLRAVNASGVPMLTSGSDLPLEIDGTDLTSNPGPGGHTGERDHERVGPGKVERPEGTARPGDG